MVDVGGKPILWHIMKLFSHYGITDFVIPIGYRGQVIKEYFLNYEAFSNDFTIHLGQAHEVEFHTSHLESDWRGGGWGPRLAGQGGGRGKENERRRTRETLLG